MFDLGSPIDKGYQRNADQTQVGHFTKQMEPVSSAGIVPQARAQAVQSVASPLLTVGQNAAKYVSTYNSALRTAMQEGIDKVAASGADMASEGIKNGIKAAAKHSAKTTANKVLGAANIALNAYGAIHGGLGLMNNMKDSDTFSAGDISNMSSKSTEYTNGVAYDVMGGYDASGVDSAVRAQNKANKIAGIGAGFEAGAGIGGLIGSIFPGAGTLIGSGIGAVLGAIGGGFLGGHARRKRERAIEEAKNRYAIAASNYNLQSESEAASQGLRNQYYATHADKGLPISNKRPNAYVGALETLVGTDGHGNVDSAIVLPETSNHKRRRDDYLVHLDEGTGVAGNKIDPYTGLTIAEKVAPLAMMFNSTTNKSDKKVIGDAIKDEMNLQDRLPDNNPSPYETIMADKGKSIRRYLPSFDFGNWDGAEVPLASYLVNEMDDYAMKKSVDRDPIIANMSYAPNPHLVQAGALMPKMVDISPQLRANNDALRHYNYAIDQASGSAGQKMIQKLAGFGKAIKNQSDIIASKTDRENAMRQQYAQWLSSVGESAAQRKQQAMQKYDEMLARGYAQKRQLQDVLAKNRRSNRNDLAQNLYNIIWGNKNIDLYYQKLRQDQKNDVEKMGTSGNHYWNPAFAFVPRTIRLPF